MKFTFINTILLVIAISCVRSSKDKPESKETFFRKNAIPEKNLILNYKPDSIVLLEFYEDTTISIFLNSRDSLGKYFYDLGIKRMTAKDLNRAIGEFKTSFDYGFLQASSLAAVGNCFYQLGKDDSALFYVNKALEIDSAEFEAKMIKDWIENRK